MSYECKLEWQEANGAEAVQQVCSQLAPDASRSVSRALALSRSQGMPCAPEVMDEVPLQYVPAGNLL